MPHYYPRQYCEILEKTGCETDYRIDGLEHYSQLGLIAA